MKILVADAFSERRLADLSAAAPGVEVVYRPELTARELETDLIADASILIVRSTEVTAAAIGRAEVLTLIVRAGAGVNTIDTVAASERGIYVANCPGKNAIAVAELTLGLILALDRRIPDATRDLHAGRWAKKTYGKADGLYGKTLGLIGLGSIGREVLSRARAFGLVPIAFSRSLDAKTAQQLGVERMSSVEELCRRADIVSVHVALTAETRGLLGRKELAALRPRAMLINTARAEVIDRAALEEALADESRGLRYAADVFHDEPKGSQGSCEDAIAKNPRVIGTHHIGASTEQAQDAIAEEAVRIVRSFLLVGEVPNCVNVIRRSPARWQLIVRHYDKVGVLANVLSLIKRHNINVEELENTIFEGAKAACAKIRLGEKPPEDLMAELRALHHEVMHAELTPLP